jgi:hypothetical protein
MFRKQRAQERRAQGLPRQSSKALGTTNKESLTVLLHWFLPDDGIFAKVKLHGNTTWSPRSLVWLALCWAWSRAGAHFGQFRLAQ